MRVECPMCSRRRLRTGAASRSRCSGRRRRAASSGRDSWPRSGFSRLSTITTAAPHRVTLTRPFWIGQTVMPQTMHGNAAEWAAFVELYKPVIRNYATYGKENLTDADWSPIVDGEEANYNFFKITVEMR